MEDVTELRKRFSSPSEASLQIKPLVPAIDFVRSTFQIWDKIVNDRTLDIPSHQVVIEVVIEVGLDYEFQPPPARPSIYIRCSSSLLFWCKVMIAKIKCEQIDNDKFNGFITNEEIKPIFDSLLDNLSSQALSDFKLKIDKELNEGKKFSQAANWSRMLTMFESAYEDSKIQQVEWTIAKKIEWTSVNVKKKLVAQMRDHANSIRSIKQNEFKNQVMSKLKSGLIKSMGAILKTPENNMWDKLNDLFRHETDLAYYEFRAALVDFGVDNTTKLEELQTLMGYGRHIIEKSVRKEIPQIVQIMQKKFCQILLNESPDSIIARTWKGTDNLQDIIKLARIECVNIISVMAINRLENKEGDNIQQILVNTLLQEGGEESLPSNNWDGVEASKTLISPAACAIIWDQFLKSSGLIINSVEQTIQARIDADKAGLAPDDEVSF
ncbi:protein ROOT HAIR DEFECTIVE 3 homolog 2-like [Impatiens glandulifera]|uniref:protein ROOT HAIR DEFECTIVE 3 homolog 2-like n=1 Tax=Impatiens glandulifera TaxID=253017 RepID=UPI001FB08E61|nr:protein ROOT HAIR DEFECTIVE 3 homolog 2-like [Impatiens glandulifera]